MLIGNVLVAGCDDGLIRLWDIKTGIYIYIYIPSPLGMRVSNTRQCMTQEILTLKKIKIIYIFFSLRKAYLEIILL
jgi:WD40 repeat protein